LLLREGFKGSRPNVPDIAIVVTDGHSNDPNETASAAVAIKNAGYIIKRLFKFKNKR